MSEETTKKSNNPYLVPGAIVIAGLCVSLAVYASKGAPQQQLPEQTGPVEIKEDHLAITEDDHILGPSDPDVYLIEYSDYRCGYCGVFHETVRQILEEYEGRVAWVYRHTPYQPGGKEAALASECIADQLGEDGFWAYTDSAFENQGDISDEWSKNKALELGADGAEYDECISSGKFNGLISKHTLGSQELGGQGTPYNILLTRENGIVKFSGAQPIETVKMFVDRALGTLE